MLGRENLTAWYGYLGLVREQLWGLVQLRGKRTLYHSGYLPQMPSQYVIGRG